MAKQSNKSKSGSSLCEQYTVGIEVESGKLDFMKFSISFSFVNVYFLDVFKTAKTLLIFVLTSLESEMFPKVLLLTIV